MGKLTKNRTAAIISPSVQNPLWGGILYFASFTVRPVVACFIIPYIYIYMHTYTSETHPFTYSSRIEVSIRSHRKIQTDPLWSLYGNAKLLLEVADLGFAGGVVLIFDLHLGSQEAVESIRIVGNMWGKNTKWKNIWTWMIQKRCLTMNYFIKYDVLPPKLNSWPIWL